MHIFVELFHGEMHLDDGNMLKEFQQILVHTFLEIGLHHLQPFLIFLKIRSSVGQDFFIGRCIRMMEACSQNFSSFKSTF